MATDYRYTDSEEIWLRILYSILGLIFLAVLLASILNFVKYMTKMEDRSSHVILFYILVFVVSVAHIVVFVTLLVNAEIDPMIYG